jgi:hypothetical protein
LYICACIQGAFTPEHPARQCGHRIHTFAFDIDDDRHAGISQEIETSFGHEALQKQQIRALLEDALHGHPQVLFLLDGAPRLACLMILRDQRRESRILLPRKYSTDPASSSNVSPVPSPAGGSLRAIFLCTT